MLPMGCRLLLLRLTKVPLPWLSSTASSATGISTRNLVAGLGLDGCDHGLIGSDGKVRDGEYRYLDIMFDAF